MTPLITRIPQFQDTFIKMYPELVGKGQTVKSITFVNTQQCQLRCSYCYQHGKNDVSMTRETAKKAIDMLFEEYNKNGYIGEDNAQCVILEFIGGEPLLNLDVMDYTVEYFKHKAALLKHSWAIYYMINMTTNGILYDDPKVQDFLKRNKGRVSISITMDGNKELHDSCRKFPDGSGSYDIVEKSVKQLLLDTGYVSTKLTLAPANISYLYDAMLNLYSLGMNDIASNCIFEKGWATKHAVIFYDQLKKLANYLIENVGLSTTLFQDMIGKPMSENENNNWCGGTGKMLAITPDGSIYPCLRYTEFSLKKGCEPLTIGNIDTGIGVSKEDAETIDMLNAITRRSQSTDECFNCPIASGCAWCSAYNYEETGTPNKRVTYICIMHKARVLANVYYWNKLYKKLDMPDRFEMNVPKEWALEIIDEDEYNMLCDLSK